MKRKLGYARERLGRSVESVLAILIIIGAIALIYDVLEGNRGLDLSYISANWSRYVRAMEINLAATTISFFLGMGIGFLVGWVRTVRTPPIQKILADFRHAEREGSARGKPALAATVLGVGLRHYIRRVADAYVEAVRGTPLFVQIIFAYTVVTVSFPRLPGGAEFLAGVLALTVNTGGYQGEIFRGGLQTVHTGQVEAARAMGLSRWGAMRFVVLPQALRLVIPPLTNEYIGLLKASALLYYISVLEITFLSKQEAYLGHPFESFALITGIFLLITVSLSKVIQYFEGKYRIPGLGLQAAPG